MNAVWEEVVVETFEDNFKKLPVKNFIIAHRDVVELFTAMEDLEHLATCSSEGKDPKMDVLRRVLTWSRLGRSLFHDMGKKQSFQLFVAFIGE